MIVEIGNKIKIKNYDKNIEHWCNENLIITNPTWDTLKRLGKEDTIKYKHVPEKIKCFVRNADTLEIPFGCLYGVWPFIKDSKINLKLNNNSFISLHGVKCPVELYDYQKEAVQQMLKARGGVLVSPCGSGKGLPLNAKIYTPDGWKYNGDLAIGDIIIGSNGKGIKVTGIYDKGLVDAYKITFSDGTEIVCDKDHLWSVQKSWQRNSNNEFKVWKTEDIYELYNKDFKRGHELYIPIVKPVEFKRKEVEIDPWLLGFLIGDGCLGYNYTHFSNNENDLIEKVKTKTNDKVNKLKSRYDYSLTGCETFLKIRKLGLDNKRSYEKFIPNEYKYNDIETRLSVLQGLFDSDGCIENKMYTFTTTSKQLAYDFLEIVQSLGGTGKIKMRNKKYVYKGLKKEGRTAYIISFKLYKFKPFTSLKHQNKYQEREKYIKPYRIIKKIEKTEPIISRCITVDAEDELYVTDNFIVTHNTFMGIEIIRNLGLKFLWLTHTGDLLRQTYKEFKNLYPFMDIGLITEGKIEIGKDGAISTIQTLCNINPEEYYKEFDIVICDECAHVSGSPTISKMFSKVIEKIPARYKYGLTATPKRGDTMTDTMYMLIGMSTNGKFEPTFKIDKSKVKTMIAQHMMYPLETVIPYDSNVYDVDGTMIYNELINYLSEDERRNSIIVKNIKECHKHGRKQVVLCQRVEHCKILADMITKEGIKVEIATGKTAAKKRNEILNDNSNWEVLVSTYALLKEGVSIKTLDTLHMTTPIKDKSTVVQCVGRIERFLENKKQPIVYDYVDQNIRYCLKAYNDRKRSIKNRF